jgi:serine/threonine-protein kinase
MEKPFAVQHNHIRISMRTAVDNNSEIVLGDRYKILGHLGSGGMANVYKARDLNLQRDVAVKMLREDLIADPSFRARFLQEARSAANLIHPNIVTVYDFGYDVKRYYIVMEYVDGTDLKSTIRDIEDISIKKRLDLMIQICEGVGYAHRAGLVHCDLKPQNILVSPDGRAKITDFGISQALASINPDEFTDIVWGSPKYFAPEQAAGAAPSPSSDVYALGVILFEMLTGQLPFEAETAQGFSELHQTEAPPSPRSLNAEISPTLESILLKVLSKEPAARYRTANQLGGVLRTLVDYGEQHPSFASSTSQEPLPGEIRRASSVAFPFHFDQVDWIAVLLGLLAFLALGGLIPLWLWVCLRYPACPI